MNTTDTIISLLLKRDRRTRNQPHGYVRLLKSVTDPWENSPYNPIVHTYSATDSWWSKGH